MWKTLHSALQKYMYEAHHPGKHTIGTHKFLTYSIVHTAQKTTSLLTDVFLEVMG